MVAVDVVDVSTSNRSTFTFRTRNRYRKIDILKENSMEFKMQQNIQAAPYPNQVDLETE